MEAQRMIIVGERLNSTRKSIKPAMAKRDGAFLLDEARRQWEAGCDYLDVNSAMLGKDEIECLKWMVHLIQGEIPDALIAIDSANPLAVAAGLEVHRGRAMLNSINGEKKRMEELLPLIREFRPRVVGLAMDDDGIDRDVQKRLDIGSMLVERVAEQGVALDDIFIDPLVFPVSAENEAGVTALDIMAKLKDAYAGVHVICGLSNISFGLPVRKHINQVYVTMAMSRGLDAVIVDPLDRRMMANIVAARMLLGQDPACRAYLAAYRKGRFDLDRALAVAPT
jgi:5-methyltetrahydrofolate--homocysteine methyltransferase